MSIEQRARKVLSDAESELRRLIAAAAQAGDYTSVEAVTSWAAILNQAVADGRAPTSSPSPCSDAKSRTRNSSKKRTKASQKKTTRSKAKTRSYPKFARSGDSLVKIAWSKSQKGEYKHKSPRSVLLLLVDALDDLLGEGSLVAMEDILPLRAEDGQEIPDYQVYLCLAWLRSIGAVQQKGRQGYTRSGLADNLKQIVTDKWNGLRNDV